ncbi:DUF1345 domain-containing protein [Microbacterium sp. X-17]|uniref:DUF1345 domain-containing protein n=1 Tax=Microbacterium sp. X-17 TaxID=3144404 RepID=UPI0031F4BA38
MQHSRMTTIGVLVLRSLDLVAQLLLIVFGTQFILTEDESPEGFFLWLFGFCVVGSLYWLAAVIVAWRSAVRPLAQTAPIADALDRWPLVRFVAGFATFIASAMGIWSASVLLGLRDNEQWGPAITFVAVWAMLLSWALFHWGFARIYQRSYGRSDRPPLIFPGTEHPRLVDFLYFSFTNATAFSVSDVSVATTRMRWTVMWHTTISFFLNALIIVLAINTITR